MTQLSRAGRLLPTLLRLMVKPMFASAPVGLQRASMALAGPLSRIPAAARFQPQTLNGVAGERASGAQSSETAAILYLHGGGYCIGSAQSHRPITGTLALASGMPVHALAYRLAPEHPFPAALDDALAAYKALADAGVKRIALAGDSAGGGLALSTAVEILRMGLQRPAALLLISPWADLGCDGPAHTTHAARDPMLGPKGLKRWAAAYRAATPASDPRCSPLHADLRGLPPVLIQAGSEEVLSGDSLALEQRLVAAGVSVRLHIAKGLWHVYQIHTGVLPEADQALRDMAAFLAAIEE